jgi:ABC-2 type transport system ATP-binding protein
MIKVENAVQIYGKQVIFEQATFQIKKGERVAVVGRNGAGKTTLLHALLGFARLKQGSITIDGKPVHQPSSWNGSLSYLPEKFQLYGQLTVEENVNYFADSFGVSPDEVEGVLTLTDMKDHKKKRIGQLSKGMLQRTGLSIAVLGEPDWVVLDEPTSGLDPFGRSDMMQLMKKIGSKGRSIIFTTHHMNEVKEIATHVLYLEEKRIDKMRTDEFFKEFNKEVVV